MKTAEQWLTENWGLTPTEHQADLLRDIRAIQADALDAAARIADKEKIAAELTYKNQAIEERDKIIAGLRESLRQNFPV